MNSDGSGCHPSAALLLVNGVVRQACGTKPAESVAIADGVLIAVGSTVELLELRSSGTEVIDLHGMTVLPGFVDSHVHAFLTTVARSSAPLQGASSVPHVLERMMAHAAETPGDGWVYGFGCGPWDLRERRYPTMEELDQVIPDRPAYICSTTLHSSAVNSCGFRQLGFDSSTPGIDREAHAGRPTGAFLRDDISFRAARGAYAAFTDGQIESGYREVVRTALAKGVTTMHCLEGQFIDADRDVHILNGIKSSLDLNAVLYYQTLDVDKARALGLSRIGGCLAVDGAGFEHTALHSEPYADDPSCYGVLNIPEETVHAFVSEAHASNLQVAMHAIGDRAIDIVARAYASAQHIHPRKNARHRIEHFHLPTEEAIRLACDHTFALPMQPIYSYLWDREPRNDYERIWGPQRAERCEPFARLCGLGLTVAGGSDSPVTSIDPLLGIHSAVNNPRASRRTTLDDAIRMFTVNGAWAAHEEHLRGTLLPRMAADLVVLSDDPYAAPDTIKDIAVQMTIAAGEVKYAVQ